MVKIHGTKGEVKIALTRNIKLKEWAFLEFRGKPVPFSIESIKGDLSEEIILKLQGVETMAEAATLLGHIFLLPNKQVKKEERSTEFDLKGYLLIDKQLGEIGLIEEIVDNQFQSLALIQYKGNEVLIPLVEEIITEINQRKKTVWAILPIGLLDIN